MSNLVNHAKQELKAIGMSSESEGMDLMMYNSLMEIVEVFSKQGHSGFSASYAISTLSKLLDYEPLAPLTGEDDEWNDVSEAMGEPCWQNKRCSHVFKDKNGAYDGEGIIFKEEDGSGYTNHNSRVPVTFPYTPTREYVPASDDPARKES